MSLTDKIIKNTFYHFISQLITFLSPLILTPIIISKIGDVQFGIYAIVLGFIGTFGLFDLSVSTSFIKFISEHYNKKEFDELNHTINTGLFFYFLFSILVCSFVFFMSGTILKFVNVPSDLVETGLFSLRISLAIFFIANLTTVFIAVLTSLQKMYLNSFVGIAINTLNFFSIFILLNLGFGLEGILVSQLAATAISALFTFMISKKELPEMKVGFSNIYFPSFKKMFSFGLQMQVSRISSFLSEKYDELLLGYFSVLNNVTYYNLASRVTRLGKFFPIQLFQQVAPVAAELNAKNDKNKLYLLFVEATKYLTLFSLPIFIYLIFFSELVVTTWVGGGYSVSSYLLRILAAGQLINLVLSAPGNSIIPNLGIPKYLMREGLIGLGINLVASYFFIKYLGILGAAIGTSIATVISSFYIFITSTKFFGQSRPALFTKIYLKPLVIGFLSCSITYFVYTVFAGNLPEGLSRLTGILFLAATGLACLLLYILGLYLFGYLNEKDRNNLRTMMKLLLFKKDHV